MKRMLDLFSGLHGASAAFRRHPDWEVVSIDNNLDLDADHHLDITLSTKQILELGRFDLIWASPPCIEFARHRLPWIKRPPGPPDMRPVDVSRDIIALMDPAYWVVENTKSGAHFITPELGEPRLIAGPYYLWGQFPRFDPRLPDVEKGNISNSRDPMRSNKRSKIPVEVSAGLLDAIMNQTLLEIEYE